MRKNLCIGFMVLMVFLVTACAWSKEDIVASDIMGIEGVDFDSAGNLFTTGNIKVENGFKKFVWKIGLNGEKTQFAEITEKGDKLASVGIAWHSIAINGLLIDGHDNIWLTSGQPCAVFMVNQSGKVSKIYLNSQYALATAPETNYPYGSPYGVAWDPDSKSVFLVTTGPEQGWIAYSIHIHNLPEKNISELEKENGLQFIPNMGWEIKKASVRGMFKGAGTPLYAICGKSLYRFDKNGTMIQCGADIPEGFIVAGVTDEKGIIFLAAVKFLEETSAGPIETHIYKVQNNGKKSLFYKAVGYCTGMAYRKSYLYLTDAKKNTIYRIKTR